MSKCSEFRAVKYFCGLLFKHEAAAESAIARLQELIAPVDGSSALIPFTLSAYYREEMGEPIFRRFVSFRGLLDPQRLPEYKLAAMQLEEQLAVGGRRTVNVDPGYLSDANVIIATAKNQFHRVPLRDGIYAHMEYTLKDGRINLLPWTYPDFKTGAYVDFFTHLLEAYRRERKEAIRNSAKV
ncbi:MAG: DUF4416 family protein [Acidobacteria bacterium]|jgi:hypothetical protein|nr:DUF4416 family protein [Acidobacteriota bacterium]